MNYEANIDSSDVSIYGIDRYFGVDLGTIDANANLKVEYSLEPEGRSWGIKSIYISLDSITGIINWETYLDEISEEEKEKLLAKGGKIYKSRIEGEINFSAKVYKDWTIEHSLEFDKDGSFSIDGAEIDFKTKTLTIL
jgi:hypothetical protein